MDVARLATLQDDTFSTVLRHLLRHHALHQSRRYRLHALCGRLRVSQLEKQSRIHTGTKGESVEQQVFSMRIKANCNLLESRLETTHARYHHVPS